MKSRTRFPVGGWQMLHPEAGQKKPWAGSLNEIVLKELDYRRKNLALARKNNWSLELEDIENDVDEMNAQRMVAGGYLNFVDMEGSSPPQSMGGSSRSGHGGAVAAAKAIVAGVGVWLDWLGADGTPVNQALAEKRAAVCADCPKNDGGDWKQYFIGPAAAIIKKQLEIKHQLELKTSVDEKLTVCSACDCPLSLKVWTPFDIIMSKTSDDVWSKFDSRCWLLSERKDSTKNANV